MNESKIINLSSITYATKGRNLLYKFGIHADIIKSPSVSGQPSCGYSLVVPYKGEAAVELLRKKGFKILSVSEGEDF